MLSVVWKPKGACAAAVDWARERGLGTKVRKVEGGTLIHTMVKTVALSSHGQRHDLIDFPKGSCWLLWGSQLPRSSKVGSFLSCFH